MNYEKFGDIEPLRYDLIMADPPWSFKRWGKGNSRCADSHYDVMTLDDIKEMRVSHLASADCVLWLWATAPMLPQAIDTMKAWGFEYKTHGVWRKLTKNGKVRFGTGYRLRSTHEPFLIGTIGNPKTPRNIPSILDGIAREHSRKPEEAFLCAEAMVPHGNRLELFSRQSRPGWDAFGNEAGAFDIKVEL